MCSIFSNDNKGYVRRRTKTNNSRWIEAKNNMEGTKALDRANIAGQYTHREPTDVTNVDVVTYVTPIGKGLDQAN